jgi:integrase
MEPFTIHDIRRSVATGLARLGVLPHIIEAVLNHTGGSISGITRVYNRYNLEPERAAALDRWDAHVAALIRPGGVVVVPFKAALQTQKE